MAEYLNATCSICGKKYHLCSTCENIKTFAPWRNITDTIDCYKIFLVLSEYTKTKNKNISILSFWQINVAMNM